LAGPQVAAGVGGSSRTIFYKNDPNGAVEGALPEVLAFIGR
jgi:hypothetical protein